MACTRAEEPEGQLSRGNKLAVSAAVLTTLFLNQFALNFGDFAASTDFFAYLVLAVSGLFSSRAAVAWRLLPFLLWLAWSVITGLQRSAGPASGSSVALLLVLYLPFLILRDRSSESSLEARAAMRTYVAGVSALAAIACIQFVLVNGAGLKSLANISLHIPDWLHAAGLYTFVQEQAGITKANGFFLRESSTLSIVTALAIVFELEGRARPFVFALLTAGLLVSMSGSGLLLLAVTFLLPTTVQAVPFSGALLLFGFVSYEVGSAIPGLDLILQRLGEFQTVGSSGYARFVAPLEMIERWMNADQGTFLFGFGGGSYFRALALLRLSYEVHDPTWAKLIYEYGLLGCICVLALVAMRVYSSVLPLRACHALVYAWLFAGGQLLNPGMLLTIWLLTLAPRSIRPHPATDSAPSMVARAQGG